MQYRWVFITASLLALIPLAWCITLAMWGRRVAEVAWWIAGALSLSFVADLFGSMGYAPLASNLYPVVLGSTLGAVLMEARQAKLFALLLALLAFVSLAWRSAEGLDILTRTVAFGGVTVAAWRCPVVCPRLRQAVTILCAGGVVAWWGYVLHPGWSSWLTVQGVRVAGTAWFCRAAFPDIRWAA